ncbi:MAG: molybdopterin-synthase adenylyltransferase MoeB [Pseudomonadota bacterium]
MKLTSEETERYARHIVMPEIGGPGQQKLKQSRVAVVGAGGLGSPALIYLAAAGVGHLTVIDDDEVALSNLQRQVLHQTSAIGKPKVTNAAKNLKHINPHVNVAPIAERLLAENAEDLLREHDAVVDGSDSFSTRKIIANVCADLRIPMIHGALGRFDGMVTVFAPFADNNPRFEDLYDTEPDESALPTCAQAGVLGAVAGVIGTLQATEVIKLLLGIGKPLVGEVLTVNVFDMELRKMRYRRKC